MNLRKKYLEELLPAYTNMLEVLDEGEVGSGKMIASVKSVCGLFNDLVDYIAKEHPKYVENSWGAKDTKELREKLENRNHQILGLTVNGKFFGLIRDIANTSKHLKISRTNAQVRHVDQVRESIAIIQHEDSEGEYYNTVSTVVVDHVDGSRIPVEIYLYLCFLAFTSLLIELKVIPGEPKIYRVKRSFYKSREEATLEASFNFTRFESVNVAMSSYIYDGNPLCPIRATDQNDKFECEIPINYEIKKGVF